MRKSITMHKYIQYFLFTSILTLNAISGITNRTALAAMAMKSHNNTKLGLKALGIAANYFTTYKMIKYIENNQDIVSMSPRGGIVIDLSNIPAGFIGIASFAFGTKLLFSACEQIIEKYVLKFPAKDSKIKNSGQSGKHLLHQIETENSSGNDKEKIRQKLLQYIHDSRQLKRTHRSQGNL